MSTTSAAPLWIGTSWKMNKTLAEGRLWAEGLRQHLDGRTLSGIQPFVIPSFTATATVSEALGHDTQVLLGVQNAHWEDAGAWTGEISVPQAKDAGARLVEIGHSERRAHFGETVHTTRLKVAATLRHGMIPLLCVGESEEVRAAGGSADYVLEQAHGALEGVSASDRARVLIAYEPIWAIGEHGRQPSMHEIEPTLTALMEDLGEGHRAILYGGSVNRGNAAELLCIPGIGGLFIGRAAWDLHGYLTILHMAEAMSNS